MSCFKPADPDRLQVMADASRDWYFRQGTKSHYYKEYEDAVAHGTLTEAQVKADYNAYLIANGVTPGAEPKNAEEAIY